MNMMGFIFFFFLQAEDGIRYPLVTGVQTCALPICSSAARSPGIRDPRWPSTRNCGSTPACRCTSVTRTARGSAARTRTPTVSCASTSRKEQTSQDTAPTPSPLSRPHLTPDPARHSAGKRRPRRSTNTYDRVNRTSLRRPVESGQYASIAMGRTLRDSKIMASMGSKGDPWDNACAESCISTIKNELVKRRTFQTRDQARLALFRYIEAFYNPLRRHSSLDMLSPDEYERRYWEDNAAAAAA